jgi:hypothetical protein
MKIPLLEGRDLRPDETGAAIVNREFVRKYFSGTDPIGKSFDAVPGGGWAGHLQIVGVAGDTRYRTVRDPIVPIVYIPYTSAWHVESFIVRLSTAEGAAGSTALASILRREVARAMPGFRVTRIRTQEGMFQAQTVRERLLAMLGLFFAAVALLLAAVGIYGVLDYSVFQRRREIGIRMAIGAQAGSIVQLVTVEIFVMVLGGGLAGVALSLAVVRFVRTLLYQVRPADWGALALPSLMLLTAGLLAALPAVVRAVRVDPVKVLRAD